MSALENIKGKFKEFVLTTWSIKNKTSIYLMMLFVSLAGIYQFITLPKSNFLISLSLLFMYKLYM